jgi:hypothetical protein
MPLLEPDANLDKSTAKTITLAGKEYFVAPLPLRQVLAMADLLPKLKDITIENMSGTMFEPVIDLVQRSLLRVYPAVTKEDLLDMTITISELIAAIPVVIEQAGGKAADKATGEVLAANPSTPSIGAGSSPTL